MTMQIARLRVEYVTVDTINAAYDGRKPCFFEFYKVSENGCRITINVAKFLEHFAVREGAIYRRKDLQHR